MKLLIRAPNWIGDAVLCVPALRELRRLYPEDCLTVLARSWVAPIFEELGVADRVLTFPEEFFAASRKPRLRVPALVPTARWLNEQGFQRAILFQNAFEAAFLVFAARIPDRIGYAADARSPFLTRRAHRRTRRASLIRSLVVRTARRLRIHLPFDWWLVRSRRHHEAFLYLDLLFQTGLSPVDYLNTPGYLPDARLAAGTEARRKAKDILEAHCLQGENPLVIVHPGSAYGPAKRWRPAGFAAVADHLIQTAGVRLAILGWGSDAAIAREVAANMKSAAPVLTGTPDLSRTLGLIAMSRLIITSDSGPMHLAAGLNIPQVALFGSTDPATTGPLASSSAVIYAQAECSPCHLRRCPIGLLCWSKISMHEVCQAATRLLSEDFFEPPRPPRFLG